MAKVELGMVHVVAGWGYVAARGTEEKGLFVGEDERRMVYVVADPVCVGPGGRDGGGSCVEEVELGIARLGDTGGQGGDLLVERVELGMVYLVASA